ncbi:MAG: DNA primase [Clostridia bacterium]
MIQREGYPLEWLQELKDKNNIVEVVSKYVQLTPKGNRFWGCCPFHHEKTPSFAVNDEGFYYCFGCHESGDVIKFVMKIEGQTFTEAVQALAERVGMQMPNLVDVTRVQAAKKKRDRLFEILSITAKRYNENLMSEDGAVAMAYLLKRGISRNLAVRFGLGYSKSYDDVISILKKKGFTDDEIYESGVGWKSEKVNKPFDALQQRLIVPIIDSTSRVIAFSGRVLSKEFTGGKYVNYHNTPVFEKNKVLYGINFVKREKQQKGIDNVIIVEGYMDVIALAKYGFNNAVAGMGTALGAGQARELKNLSENIYVCYDGDTAGAKAAISNLELLNSEGVNLNVVTLPSGLDPDDTIKKYGADGFKSLLEKALPYIEYRLKIIENKYKLDTQTGRAKYVKEALDFIKSIPNKAQQEVYLEIINDKSRVATNILREGLVMDVAKEQVSLKKEKVVRAETDATIKAGRFVLKCLIDADRFASFQDISREILTDETHKKIYDYIVDEIKKGNKPVVHMLYTIVSGLDKPDDADVALGDDEKPYNEVANVVYSSVEFSDDLQKSYYYRDSVRLLKNSFINSKIKELSCSFDSASDDERGEMRIELVKYQKMLKEINSKE